MTYNFDPDQWYENEIAFLEKKYTLGEIARPEFNQKLTELTRRYEAILDRLDGNVSDLMTARPVMPNNR